MAGTAAESGYGAPIATVTTAPEPGAVLSGPPQPVPALEPSSTTAAADSTTTTTLEPTFSVPTTLAAGPDTSAGDTDIVAVDDLDDTTIVIDDPEHDHAAHDVAEESEPDAVAAEGFSISSNLDAGVEYPLEAMVDLAVELLRAETTGAGRDNYEHLVDQVSVCCSDLEVLGAVVLFGAAATDPATIIVEWIAVSIADGDAVSASTQSLWWFRDGDWLGEFEMSDS